MLVGKQLFICSIISKLFRKKWVVIDMVPIIQYTWHVWEVGEGGAEVREMFVKKEKAIVIYVVI